MHKPPFQFRLKAIILATSGAAFLACLAVPGVRQVRQFVALAAIAALMLALLLAAAVLVAFGFSLAMLAYHAFRPLRDWLRNKR